MFLQVGGAYEKMSQKLRRLEGQAQCSARLQASGQTRTAPVPQPVRKLLVQVHLAEQQARQARRALLVPCQRLVGAQGKSGRPN